MLELTRCARSESCLSNSVPSIFTAANEHEIEERGRRVLQKVDREGEGGREEEKKKKSRMEIRLGRRSDEDNKSSHPGVSEPPVPPPASNRPPRQEA